MFSSIFKKLHFLRLMSQNSEKDKGTSRQEHSKLSRDLQQNLNTIKNVLGTSSDVIIREFTFGLKQKVSAALIFIDGLADDSTINEIILKPLMYDSRLTALGETLTAENMEIIKKNMLAVREVEEATSIVKVIDSCLTGDSILLIQGFKEALIISTKGWETRSIQEPLTEAVVRGPREGFTESLGTNTAMLRRKIKDPKLTLEKLKVGQRTKTTVCIAFLEGITNPRLVEEIKRRINKINTDAILESGYIEQFIEDAPFSPFATVGNSEKPDVVAAKILEGRAAIMVDGTPIVLTVPMVFMESFQSAEDYYSRPYYVSLIRILRFLGFFIGILGPATYVALVSYHQELIPASLLLTMVAASEGTPFPAVVEAIIMGIAFELLREAGVRLPRPVGQAVSIVGALVIGQSAVQAGLIGAPMVIVVALTAIASFVVPSQADATGLIRLTLVMLAGILGAFGIVIGLLVILIHLSTLRSFGTPYLSPLAPLTPRDLKDTFIRAPIWTMFTRPRTIGWHDPQRQEFRLWPKPPREKK